MSETPSYGDITTPLTIRSARVQGLEEDLGMEGNQFNIAVSVLFVGYILGQIPSNLILSRVRPSLYLSLFVALWGAVSTCTAAATTFNHLVVLRFFLGVTEAPYFPGALFLLSAWYTKKVGTRSCCRPMLIYQELAVSDADGFYHYVPLLTCTLVPNSDSVSYQASPE